jgi:hypothetical protein
MTGSFPKQLQLQGKHAAKLGCLKHEMSLEADPVVSVINDSNQEYSEPMIMKARTCDGKRTKNRGLVWGR